MITHDGEKMPVSGNTRVRVRYFTEETDEDIAEEFDWCWCYKDNPGSYDIIEYEVLEEVKSEREILVTSNDTHEYYIGTESEFLKTVETDYSRPGDFFADYNAFVIKDGKFVALTEEDIEMNPKLKI